MAEESVQENQQQNQRQGQHLDANAQAGHEQFLYFGDETFSSLAENVASRDIRSTDAPSELETAMRASTESDHGRPPSNLMTISTHQEQHRLQAPASNLNLDSWSMESQNARQGIPDQLADGSLRDSGTSPDWFRRNTYPLSNAGSESGESTSRWQRNGPWLLRSPFMSSNASISAELDDGIHGNTMTGISNDDLNFDLLGSLGILTRNRITPAPTAQQPSLPAMLHTVASTTSTGLSIAPPARNTVASETTTSDNIGTDDGTKTTLHDAVRTTYGDSPMRRRFEESGRRHSCPFHKVNTDDELVRIVGGYPRVMVRPGVYPPFVHHRLYRCTAGDVSEPLARAFCCIGAFYASVPTSETFVYSLIDEESSKLVKAFVSWHVNIITSRLHLH